MKRKSNYNASLAIARLSVAIKYLSWELQSEATTEKLMWRNEALRKIDAAKMVLEKDLPF